MASIADILIAKGNAGARAVSEKGNIYADLINNLSSAPGRFIQEQRQNRMDQAKEQEQQQRLAISRGQLEQQTREFGAQQQQAQQASRIDAVLGSGVYDDAGNIDLNQVRARAGAADPALVPHAIDVAQKLNEHAASYRKIVAEADDAEFRRDERKRNALGDAAETLLANPQGVDAGSYQQAIGSFVKNKIIDPGQGEEWLKADTPEAMAANLQAMRANSKSGGPSELKEFDPTKELRDVRTGRVIRPGAPKAPEAITPYQQAEITARGQAAAETARHNRATESAMNPFGAMAGGGAAPGTPQTTGEEFLKTLPPGIASEVKAYAEGKRPFPTGISQAKLEPLIQLVGQYDPTFDAQNYTARSKARNDLVSTNGVGGKSIGALNTAVGHLEELAKAAAALKNKDFQAYNTVSNALATQFGWSGKTDFDTIAPKVADEVERLWRGSGGTEGSIERTLGALNSNMGPDQLKSAIAKTGDLIESKLTTLEQQRDQALGPGGKDVQIVFPKSRVILDRLRGAKGPTAGPRVGETVMVKGQRVKITAIHPDGSFDGDVVK